MSVLPRGYALADLDLSTFDRSTRSTVRVQRPDRYRLLESLPADVPRIARGSGVSYVAASFGDGAISQELGAFDRLLGFDAEHGLVTVEAGARIGDVARFVLRHGWSLPVVPGHPRASIGGCIAADVHGKNPARDGTFRDYVEALGVFDPLHGWLQASPHENAERFAACHAGFGIAGTIVHATLRLAPAPAAYTIRRLPVANLREARDVLVAHAGAPLLYGWHDGRARHLGRGVIRFGLESHEAAPRAKTSADLPVQVAPWRACAWTPAGIAAMNAWIHHRWCRAGSSQVDVASALFPLNDARVYYAGFGPEGFVEAQWLVPHATYDAFVDGLEALVAKHRPAITLVASKLFDGEPEGLAFDGRGIAFAIQLPRPRATTQRAFLDALTALALEQRARPNLIKDASLDAATVRQAISGFEGARARLRAFDPQGLHRSDLTRRLDL
ncbi:FAD-binding oxidoreductase [Dokdonella sp. MW10]|uniref:FAD-binding oxidoreductase n=1 Tax=Dokdonella sp. MW10 TaxID=2992926 RepID=UPI003F7F09D8